MPHFKIHPIVMGTKVFDQSMMTYQYGQGRTFTIPIGQPPSTAFNADCLHTRFS